MSSLRRLAATCLLISCAAPAFAQTAVVRSGEHEGFTRVVVTFPRATQWQLEKTSDGFVLKPERKVSHYDTSDAFRRILRDRVSEIAKVEGSSDLHLRIACACDADAMVFRDNIAVIDIRPSPVHVPEPPPAQRLRPALSGPFGWQNWTNRPSAPAPAIPAPEIPSETMRETAKDEPSVPAPLQVPATTQPALQGFAGLNIPQIGLRLGNAALPEELALLSNCTADRDLGVGLWGNGPDGVPNTLSRIHTMLKSSAGEIAVADLESAARAYLGLGFTAEARQLTSLLATDNRARPALLSLSYILEDRDPDTLGFSDMENCDSEAALWAVLENRSLRKSQSFNGAAVFRAYAALPPRLRDLVAARLTRRLEEADAASVLADMRSFNQLTAQAESSQRGTDEAPRAGQPNEPQQLIEAVQQAFHGRVTLHNAQLKSLEALNIQFRRSDLAPDLRRALVVARALAGSFDEAAKLLPETPQAIAPFVTLLAESGTDQAVLTHGLSAIAFPPSSVTEIAARTLFERLTSLGFAAEALSWAALIPVGSQDNALKLRMSEAYLRIQQPQTALVTLAGASDEANPLREQAWLMLGQPAAAAAVASQDNPDMSRSFWRVQRDWSQVATRDTGPWVAASAIVSSSGGPPAGEAISPQTLTDISKLLDETATSRDVIHSLLEGATIE